MQGKSKAGLNELICLLRKVAYYNFCLFNISGRQCLQTIVTTGVFANHKQQSHACNSIGSTLDIFFESTANRGRNLELVSTSTLEFCLTQTDSSVDNVKKCIEQLNRMTALKKRARTRTLHIKPLCNMLKVKHGHFSS